MPRITGNCGAKLRALFDELERADRPIDWNDLKELQNLALLAGNDGGAAPPDIVIDQPVWVGEIPLYRPTIASVMVCNKFLSQIDNMMLAEGYILSNARNKDALGKIRSPEHLDELVTEWAQQLTVLPEELADAIKAAYNGFPVRVKGQDSDQPERWLATAAWLMEKFGNHIDYWVWDTSFQRVVWLEAEWLWAQTPKNQTPKHKLTALKVFYDKIREIKEAAGLTQEESDESKD